MDYNWQIISENVSSMATASFGAGESERPPTATGMVVKGQQTWLK